MIISFEIVSYQKQSPGDKALKTFDHKGGSFGRADYNAWVLSDPSKVVSSQHGMVYFEAGNFYLTDISTNGIYLNGSDKPLGKGNVVSLKKGDLLNVGDYEIRVAAVDLAIPGQRPPSFSDRPPQSLPANSGYSTGSIESQGFDPLAALGRNSSERPGRTVNSSFGNQAFIPDEDFEQYSPLNDAFVPSTAVVDSDLPESSNKHAGSESPATGAAQGDAIPEDWDLTGFTTKATDSALNITKTEAMPEPASTRLEKIPEMFQTSQQTPAAASSPGSVRAGVSGDTELLLAFMNGAGISLPVAAMGETDVHTMKLAGSLFREVIEGLMVLLQSRSELKSEFRMSATTIKPTENNPLKFLPNAEAAIIALFSAHQGGYQIPEQAVQEGIRDVRNHQIAMIAGMQAGVAALLRKLKPAHFGHNNEEGLVKAALSSVNKKSRSWEQYCKFYDDSVVKSGNAFQILFGEDFGQAYEEQLRLLDASQSEKDYGG